MHTNEVSQKANLPAMTTGESDAGASILFKGVSGRSNRRLCDSLHIAMRSLYD